jgi:nucleotide-binding universal stress UspA family protein
MFENILVYLDGQGLNEGILPFVALLAGHFNSKVVLLHVIIVPTVHLGLGKTELEPLLPEQQPDSGVENLYLDGIAEPLRKNGLNVECVTVEGPLEESILTCARTFHINLIAISTHDYGILNRLIIGSTAGIIFQKSGIPVLSLSG